MNYQNNDIKDSKYGPGFCNNNYCIIFSIIIIILAFFFAFLELVLDGRCHKILNNNKAVNIIYKLFIFLGMFIVLSCVFFINKSYFNINNVLFIIAYLCIFICLKTLFWFIINPNYQANGLEINTKKFENLNYKFLKTNIPLIYIILPMIALGLSLLSGYIKTFGIGTGIWILGIGIVYCISKYLEIITDFKNDENIICNK